MRCTRSPCVPSLAWKVTPSASSLAMRWSSGFDRSSPNLSAEGFRLSTSGRSAWSVCQKYKASDSRARTTLPLPRAISAPPSLRLDVGDEDEVVGEGPFARASLLRRRLREGALTGRRPVGLAGLRPGIAPPLRPRDEALLVRLDGELDHLGRDLQERFLERAHQRHRPFDEAGDLLEQRLVRHDLQARARRRGSRRRGGSCPCAARRRARRRPSPGWRRSRRSAGRGSRRARGSDGRR